MQSTAEHLNQVVYNFVAKELFPVMTSRLPYKFNSWIMLLMYILALVGRVMQD